MTDLVFDEPQSAEGMLPRLLALPRGAAAVLLGATDSGKTTWVREAARAACAAGRSVAVVDCDLGQSEVGPPGTVGAAFAPAGSAWKLLRELPVEAGYFVGAVSPARHGLDVCAGAVRVARAVAERGPDLVLVDTDGAVGGAEACRVKRRLCELLRPRVVAALVRGDALDPLLSAFRGLDSPEVWRIPASPAAQRKTTAARQTRRAARFLSALDGSQPLLFSLDAVGLQGTRLGAGEPLPHHLLQFLGEALGRPVLHAERTGGGGLYVVVHGERWDASGLASVESYFGTRSVCVAAAQKFAGLLVGLVSRGEALLGLGRIERIDFPRRTVTVLTPCRKPAAVAQLWLGSLRLRADGQEIGEVRPGEI